MCQEDYYRPEDATVQASVVLGSKMKPLVRAVNLVQCAGRVLLSLEAFQEEARALLSDHKPMSAIFDRLYAQVMWDADTAELLDTLAAFEDGPVLRLRQDLLQLRHRWGLGSWAKGGTLIRHALWSLHRGLPGFHHADADWEPEPKTIHVVMDLHLHYQDQSLREVEAAARKEILSATMPQVRQQYQEQGMLGKQTGPEPNEEVLARDIEWYFLKRSLSYKATMVAWNQRHPDEPLDLKKDIGRVKFGINRVKTLFLG